MHIKKHNRAENIGHTASSDVKLGPIHIHIFICYVFFFGYRLMSANAFLGCSILLFGMFKIVFFYALLYLG